MLNWLFLSFVALHVAVVLTNAEIDYVECAQKDENEDLPSICDCRNKVDNCIIRFEITKNESEIESRRYSINGGVIGPTIIVKHNTIVVVDVFNNIKGEKDNVSIHWHGMHQRHAQFMDGVGWITQMPINQNESFRYIFRATPSGTHWYHSHMRFQRDKGIFGALIVKESKLHENLVNVEDLPNQNTIAIQQHSDKKSNKSENFECEPDGSKTPETYERPKAWRINGVKLSTSLDSSSSEFEPVFNVQREKKYRFRVIGAMESTVLRLSIDKHKLKVISSDGYLTNIFETDILMIHVGERFDFIPEYIGGGACVANGNVFPIRIESVAVQCSNYSKPVAVGYAYLRYTPANNDRLVTDDERCKTSCKALNCPFESYPGDIHNVSITCHPVTNLTLLNPTPPNELPENGKENVKEYFFNFDFPSIKNSQAMVNGVQFTLPSKFPFVNHERKSPNEKCNYRCIGHAFTERDIYLCKACSHTLRISDEDKKKSEPFKAKTIRFVLSSLPAKDENDPKGVTDVRTHPIHLHGHSFFVRKIAYPNYDQNWTITNVSQDLNRKDCGPLNWKNQEFMNEISPVVNSTVRKDVITVPAGGYVVIEFLADNPGWWFMHCHIDYHLKHGMAIAINELPECQNNPPKSNEFNTSNPFEDDVNSFKKDYLEKDECNINPTQIPASAPSQGDILAREPDKNIWHNMRQKSFSTVVNKDRYDQFDSSYYKRLLHQRFRAQAAVMEQRQEDRKKTEHARKWEGRNEEIEESIWQGRNEEFI